jgi:hypothetical protein
VVIGFRGGGFGEVVIIGVFRIIGGFGGFGIIGGFRIRGVQELQVILLILGNPRKGAFVTIV